MEAWLGNLRRVRVQHSALRARVEQLGYVNSCPYVNTTPISLISPVQTVMYETFDHAR